MEYFVKIIKSFALHKEYIALLCFVLADYFTGFGLALKQHRLSSAINYKGVIDKIVTLFLPLVLYPVFYIYNLEPLVTTFIYGLIIPNVISLIENLDSFGIKLPDALIKLFDKTPPK